MRKSLSNPTGSSSALNRKEDQPVGTIEERDQPWDQGLTLDQYGRYYRVTWNVAYLIVGYPDEADIIANKVMDSLWKRHTPPSKAEVEAHLRVMARSRALDCLASPRHKLRVRSKSLVQKDEDEEEYEAMPEQYCSPGAEEEFFSDGEREMFARQFAEALMSLNELQRVCFVLRFVEHIEPEEVVEMLGIPVDTVYTKTYRARKRVAGLLRDRRKK